MKVTARRFLGAESRATPDPWRRTLVSLWQSFWGGGGLEPWGCLATRKLGYIRIGCDTNEASRAITLGPHAHGRVQLDWCEVLVTICTWHVFFLP